MAEAARHDQLRLLAVDRARQAVACGKHEVERRGDDPQARLDTAAPEHLRRRKLRHGLDPTGMRRVSPPGRTLATPIVALWARIGNLRPPGERSAYCSPARASRTRVTASGKTVAITARICSACSTVVPWMLTRLTAATVMLTASWIALSAQASRC